MENSKSSGNIFRRLRRAMPPWGPVLLLVLLWTDSEFYHRCFIYCGSIGEVWLASENGVIGISLFLPYHGQHEAGFHYGPHSPVWTHISGSTEPPPRFHFDWGRRAGVFQVARVYGMAIPYWAFGVAWVLFRAIRRRRRKPRQEHQSSSECPAPVPSV